MSSIVKSIAWVVGTLACGSGVDPCPTCVPAGEMVPAGRMTQARAAHSAVLLSDGRVLVSGGCTEPGCESGPGSGTTELYDPRTGRFTRGPDLLTSRSGDHASLVFADGRVLLAGGWSGSRVGADAEIFDPATNRFTRTGALNVPRAAAVALLLRDGHVLIAGGYDGANRLASSELYDPGSRTFTPTGAMTAARSAHAATMLADGRVLVTGGDAARGTVLATAEVYDPGTGRFTATGDLSTVRYKHTVVTLADGRALVLGGSDARDWQGRYMSAEVYDPGSGRFTRTGDMRLARYKLPRGALRLPNGQVLVATGARQAELFDPATGVFSVVEGDMGAARHFGSATLLRDGTVLVLGGYDDRIQPTDQAWLFRPHSD